MSAVKTKFFDYGRKETEYLAVADLSAIVPGTHFAPELIAEKYWDMYNERQECEVVIHQPFNDYYGTYCAMEEAYTAGKVRAIGSNVIKCVTHNLKMLSVTYYV